MRLADVVSARRAIVPLASDNLAAAARALLECLVAAGVVVDPEKLDQRMAEGRPEDIVSMGDRAFLLHYRTDAVRDLVVAIGTSPERICIAGGEEDERCARIVLLIVAPPRLAALYLQVVGAFARLLSDPENVAAVVDAPTAEALAALPILAEWTLPERLLVRDIMTERPITALPDTPLREAARLMVRSRVGGLPIVDESRRVVGMLGERELLPHLLSSYLTAGAPPKPLGGEGAQRRFVRDVMTRRVLCVSPEQPLAEVASLMANKDVDRVPVVSEGRLIGLLTRGDIVRKLIGS